MLADVLFAGAPILPQSERQFDQTTPSRPPLRYEEQLENAGDAQQLTTRWFRISPLTMVELGAHVAAMLDEPDGTRLVRAVIATLEQLGITTYEEIGQAMQARLPELFAIPLVYPYDDVCVLLKEYMCQVGEARDTQAADGSDSSTSDDLATVESCERCGHEWPVSTARDWLHFEFFVCGLGCPACQGGFRDRAAHPGDGDV